MDMYLSHILTCVAHIIKTLPKNLDATDGLAAAVCHYFNYGKSADTKNYSSWSAFVKQHPSKIN